VREEFDVARIYCNAAPDDRKLEDGSRKRDAGIGKALRFRFF
jgi:hypothetical protein